MTAPLTLLGNRTVEDFLQDYWQKEPLLVRAALPGFRSPVSPEELAGLACEEEVESRLILEKGGATPWELRHGPFDEEDFLALPETHWTLLVQEINKHVPEFALLQDAFSFLPNWRLDDVMVSFAPLHGTVGPHADNYDVFLIQAQGTRRWQISRHYPTPEELVPNLPLRIMRSFQAEEEWILEPGDMLYLPPRVAHYGVALEDCLTVSVGFRAPNRRDLLEAYVTDALELYPAERFYEDPDLGAQVEPGEIAADARAKVREVIRGLAADDSAIDRWFGRYVTDVPAGHEVPSPDEPLNQEALLGRLAEFGEIWRSEYCRFAHIDAHIDKGGLVRLYVAGEEYTLPGELSEAVHLITGSRRFVRSALSPFLDDERFVRLLCELHNGGCLYFPEEA